VGIHSLKYIEKAGNASLRLFIARGPTGINHIPMDQRAVFSCNSTRQITYTFGFCTGVAAG